MASTMQRRTGVRSPLRLQPPLEQPAPPQLQRRLGIHPVRCGAARHRNSNHLGSPQRIAAIRSRSAPLQYPGQPYLGTIRYYRRSTILVRADPAPAGRHRENNLNFRTNRNCRGNCTRIELSDMYVSRDDVYPSPKPRTHGFRALDRQPFRINRFSELDRASALCHFDARSILSPCPLLRY